MSGLPEAGAACVKIFYPARVAILPQVQLSLIWLMTDLKGMKDTALPLPSHRMKPMFSLMLHSSYIVYSYFTMFFFFLFVNARAVFISFEWVYVYATGCSLVCMRLYCKGCLVYWFYVFIFASAMLTWKLNFAWRSWCTKYFFNLISSERLGFFFRERKQLGDREDKVLFCVHSLGSCLVFLFWTIQPWNVLM